MSIEWLENIWKVARNHQQYSSRKANKGKSISNDEKESQWGEYFVKLNLQHPYDLKTLTNLTIRF